MFVPANVGVLSSPTTMSTKPGGAFTGSFIGSGNDNIVPPRLLGSLGLSLGFTVGVGSEDN